VLVRIAQGVRDITQRARDLCDREFALAREPRAETLPLHERHREEEQPVALPRTEERHDVWVLKPSRELDLAAESCHADLCRQLWRQHLHDNAPSE